MSDIPRIASIDSHTILSQGYFLLLDASKDWRTMQNPFITGVPHIKFYLGVPILTKSGAAIGALSIFDSIVKKDFAIEKIKILQGFAKEIIKVLDTPIEQVKSENGKATLNEEIDGIKNLTLKIGRATSKGEQMTIFEKDGSGGPYTQNHSFRFSRYNRNDRNHLKQNQLLLEKLMNAGTLKNSATALSRYISTTYEVDFVYILEIRIAELYQIKKEYFPSKEKQVDSEKFKHASKLVRGDKSANDYITRIIGVHGCNYTNLSFESDIHYNAFTSEFGIFYHSNRETALYNEGIIMPFFRHNSKIVRKHRIKSANSVNEDGNIDVFLRSGGYLIGCFNECSKNEAFSANKISLMFECAGILRKIYISN